MLKFSPLLPRPEGAWDVWSELLIDYKLDTLRKAEEGQMVFYCDKVMHRRVRYGILCTDTFVVFILVDKDGKAYRTERQRWNKDNIRLLYLMCTRASFIPYVDIKDKTSILTLSMTGVVLETKRAIFKVAIDDADDLLATEVETSRTLQKTKGAKYFTTVEYFPTQEDNRDPAKKRRCVRILPKMDGDLSSYIKLDNVAMLGPIVQIIKIFHMAGLTHNDIRIQNVLFKSKTFRLADYGYASKPDQRFNGGGHPTFVNCTAEKLTSPRADIGMFLRSILQHLVRSDRYAYWRSLFDAEYNECEDIYKFAEDWLKSAS